MQSVGPVPKVGYIGGMGGITFVGNVDAFPGTSFGWFCPWPVSLLARWNGPVSALQNARRCECLWKDLALLLFAGERFGELPEENSLFTGVSTLSWMMGSLPLSRAVGCLT